jgi:DNA-binding MarR family transcriptional regulator
MTTRSTPRPASAGSTAAPAAPSMPCACGRLRRATRALTQLYDDALAPAGLRVNQYSLLRALQRCGPMRISELAARELVDRTALSRNLDPLVDRGLVQVVRGRDARTREVALTPAGGRELCRAEPHWQRVQDDVARRVGADRLALLVDALSDLEQLHPHANASQDPR